MVRLTYRNRPLPMEPQQNQQCAWKICNWKSRFLIDKRLNRCYRLDGKEILTSYKVRPREIPNHATNTITTIENKTYEQTHISNRTDAPSGQRTCLDVRFIYPRILPRIDGLAASLRRIKCQRRLSCDTTSTVSGYVRGCSAGMAVYSVYVWACHGPWSTMMEGTLGGVYGVYITHAGSILNFAIPFEFFTIFHLLIGIINQNGERKKRENGR